MSAIVDPRSLSAGSPSLAPVSDHATSSRARRLAPGVSAPDVETGAPRVVGGEHLPRELLPHGARAMRTRRTHHDAHHARAWLRHESRRRTSAYFESAHTYYSARATRPVAIGKHTAQPYAPLRVAFSALKTMTPHQVIALGLLVVILVSGLFLFSIATLITLLVAITLAYSINLALTSALLAHALGDADEEASDTDALLAALDNGDWPMYTILCPLYREQAVVPQFLRAIQALDYPSDRLEVLVLTESDDDATRQAMCDRELPPYVQVVTVPDGFPRTKPRACNYGLLVARGSFIVIYDAEDIPDPLQLKRAILAFARHDASLACVQARLGFYNATQNLLTRWFTIEYAVWFHIVLPGLQWAGLSLPLGGTSNHFRTDLLRRIGGWDPFNVTEDCDLGLRLAQLGLRTDILDSTTLEEANSNVRNWIRQRSRWIKGYLQTYLVNLRQPWRYVVKGQWRALFSLQFLIGGAPATSVINPLMWLMLTVYITMRAHVNAQFEMLYIAPIFYPAVLCLVFGNFLHLYVHLIACCKIKEYRLIPALALLPVYWALMSVAAVVAFWQLLVMPHYWEKTIHGLHLHPTSPPGTRAGQGQWSSDRYAGMTYE